MKAVILAAGKGTRLLPVTETIPKVLVEINGKPFLWYVLNQMSTLDIRDICLVIGYKGEMVRKFLKENNFQAECVEQKELKGTGDALRYVQSFVGDSSFIVYYGDNLFSRRDLQRFIRDDHLTYIGGVEVSNPEKYGVLLQENEYLQEIKEKPTEFFGKLVNAGLYKCTPNIFPIIEQLKMSPRGEIEFTDVITALAKERKVKVLKLADYWLDLGSKEDIGKIEQFLRSIREIS
ncbi:NTP transferase domain-containing protein [Candidatus Woesearchaeota archaeon]|nr:NTP transferase domain-containing protein [Candidatus Woesearchaeota archaeon]